MREDKDFGDLWRWALREMVVVVEEEGMILQLVSASYSVLARIQISKLIGPERAAR